MLVVEFTIFELKIGRDAPPKKLMLSLFFPNGKKVHLKVILLVSENEYYLEKIGQWLACHHIVFEILFHIYNK